MGSLQRERDGSDSNFIIGMILLNGENSFDLDEFKEKHSLVTKIEDLAGDDSALVFKVDGEQIMIAHMPFPIPSDDIEGTTQYAYNWKTALEDTKDHKSHLIISVTTGGDDRIKRFKIFTRAICSLLKVSDAIGVYEGIQSLLITKNDYLGEAGFMSDTYLPLNLWVYFGLRDSEQGNSGYTYGLKAFNKKEMEVVNSDKGLEDIRDFLFNMSHYVLEFNIEFKDGQTCGLTENQKIGISLSKGKFVGDDTFKLAY